MIKDLVLRIGNKPVEDQVDWTVASQFAVTGCGSKIILRYLCHS
jgi:hypothetical protein